jgi:amino acid transporter
VIFHSPDPRKSWLTPVIKIVVDLAVYPGQIFYFLIAIGLIMIRQRRKALNLPRPEFRAWNIALGFTLLVDLYMLIAPWYPPTGGANGGDVSFWYGTYLAVSVGL